MTPFLVAAWAAYAYGLALVLWGTAGYAADWYLTKTFGPSLEFKRYPAFLQAGAVWVIIGSVAIFILAL